MIQVGADIVKRALSYPLKLIAKNAGVNGSVVVERVLSNNDPKYGYNAATGAYEDLMAAGIIDPTKVLYVTHHHKCCLYRFLWSYLHSIFMIYLLFIQTLKLIMYTC